MKNKQPAKKHKSKGKSEEQRVAKSAFSSSGSKFLRDTSSFDFQYALQKYYEGFACDVPISLSHTATESPKNKNGVSSLPKQSSTTTIFPHDNIRRTLVEMDEAGYFRTNVTQPFGLGTKCAKTYVTRCLLGEPGTTYKYLGLRMFAHPWRNLSCSADDGTSSNTVKHGKKRKRRKMDVRSENENDKKQVCSADDKVGKNKGMMATMRQLNEILTERSNHHLSNLTTQRKRRGGVATGRESNKASFDITLINKMTPSTNLKKEPLYNKERCSVSWHADSSLEHYSTIAVYHTLFSSAELNVEESNASSNSKKTSHHQWSVALRVMPNAEGPNANQSLNKDSGTKDVDETSSDAPPIAVSLPSGSAYYLLDDFNHHHQHAVLVNNETGTTDFQNSESIREKSQDQADTTIRFSSTHRKLRGDQHTVQSMVQKCASCIANFHRKGLKVWRHEQSVLNELESEWLRQFFIQGQGHYDMLWNSYWYEPLTKLFGYWSQLEERTHQVIQTLQLAAEARCYGGTYSDLQKAEQGGDASLPQFIGKAERKRQEKRKKALTAIEGIVHRSGGVASDTNGSNKRNNKKNHNDAQEHDKHLGERSTANVVVKELYECMVQALEERAIKRELWRQREEDSVFQRMPPEYHPMSFPVQYGQNPTTSKCDSVLGRSPLPDGSPTFLRQVAADLRAWSEAFIEKDPSLLPPICKSIIKEGVVNGHNETSKTASGACAQLPTPVANKSKGKNKKRNDNSQNNNNKRPRGDDKGTATKKKKKKRY